MLPKDLTPAAIEKLKKTAEANPAGSVPTNFDPNDLTFQSNNGLTIMLTLDKRSENPYWLLSMSHPRRAPHTDEADAVVQAFFGAYPQGGKVTMPAGANPNVVYYRISAT